MIDILLKIGQLDPIVTEVPLILRYDQKESASKMDVRSNVKETFGLLCKRLFRTEKLNPQGQVHSPGLYGLSRRTE